MMPATSNRRWSRFSLRALFVVVTVLGCWLGYVTNWIHQRHAAIAWPSAVQIGPPLGLSKPLSWSLRLFGERPHGELTLLVKRESHAGALNLDAIEEAEMERLQRLFPESHVRVLATHFLHPEVLNARYADRARH
jgi:hypothetical protein